LDEAVYRRNGAAVADFTSMTRTRAGTEAALACPTSRGLQRLPEQEYTSMTYAAVPAHKPRRLRPAALHGARGASSLLRLSRATGGLPSGADLNGWMTRAGSLLEAPAQVDSIITPLKPSRSSPSVPR
jgi:hypothetical protein